MWSSLLQNLQYSEEDNFKLKSYLNNNTVDFPLTRAQATGTLKQLAKINFN